MKIDRITLDHVRVPLVEPFKISNGVIAEKDAIIVGVHIGGIVGYGESSPMSVPSILKKTPESTWDCLTKELIPLLLRETIIVDRECQRCCDTVPGNAFAKAGLETAFWISKRRGKTCPSGKLLGADRISVESGLAVGIYPTIRELLLAIERCLVEGYKRLKIKIQPGWDLKPLTEVRGNSVQYRLWLTPTVPIHERVCLI